MSPNQATVYTVSLQGSDLNQVQSDIFSKASYFSERYVFAVEQNNNLQQKWWEG